MKPLRIHYLQHVHFEDLGCIEDWAVSKGHRLTSTKFYEKELLPELSEFDWLIVMGGPMGVYDFEKYEWLSGEKEFIGKAIQNGKIVLGICLGAQLIASALSAKVYPNTEKEIGWFPISLAQDSVATILFGESGDSFPVFHWHGDTFDLPPNATRIASSEICPNQAFIYAEKVIGLQFHFEVTEKSLQRMITFCGEELVDGKYIQSVQEIISHNRFISGINEKMFQLLNKMEEI